MGRQTLEEDYEHNAIDGNYGKIYSRSATYDAKGQLTWESSSTLKNDNKTYTTTTTTNGYGSGTAYMLGAVVSQASSNAVTGSSTTNSSTTNTYTWYDGAVQNTIAYKPNTSQSTTYTTTFTYNALGQATSAYIADGKPHTVTYTNDENGQVIRRDETNVSGQTGAPHEAWYRYRGAQMGYTGNNGTNDLTQEDSVTDRRTTTPSSAGTFRNAQVSSFAYTDFTGSYDPINSFGQGSASGFYTVQQTGETLSSIAQALWGDASLWYKLAQANGMGTDGSLVAGQRLTLPVGVSGNHHNASTFAPYDANAALGNVSPTTPKPGKNGCGVFGQILLVAIAIAVTVALKVPVTNLIAGPAAAGAAGGVALTSTAGILGAAAAGAAGSIVSQGFGVATGIQDKFNWGAVAMAGIGGAVGAGLSGVGINGLGSFGNNVLRGALTSAVTQGIGVATGLQSKFDFVGVAAAGIGVGGGGAVARGLGGTGFFGHGFGNDFASTMASDLANAATRSAVNGSNFGDNVLAALPDAIGSVLGRALGGAVAGHGGSPQPNSGKNAADAATQQGTSGPSGTNTTTGDRATDIIVNQDAIRAAGDRLLAANSAITMYGDAKSAILLGADSASIEFLAMRDSLARQALSGLAPSSAGTPFKSEFANQAYSATTSQAATYFDLHVQEAYFSNVKSQAGANPTAAQQADFEELQGRLDASRVRLDAAYAIADSQINDLLRTALPPVDFAMGGYNIATGNGEIRDYFSVGGAIAGPLLGKAIGVAAPIFTRLGRAGEVAADSAGADALALRRSYLDAKFGRTGDLNNDINLRGYMSQVETLNVSSAPGDAIFYSGPGNRGLAELFGQTGGTTLESTPGGAWLDNQALFKRLPPEMASQPWDRLSQRFAQEASGSVSAFIDGASTRGTFYRVELPALQANPNVNLILRNGNQPIRLSQ